MPRTKDLPRPTLRGSRISRDSTVEDSILVRPGAETTVDDPVRLQRVGRKGTLVRRDRRVTVFGVRGRARRNKTRVPKRTIVDRGEEVQYRGVKRDPGGVRDTGVWDRVLGPVRFLSGGGVPLSPTKFLPVDWVLPRHSESGT